ncbi:MAG TPA: type II CAAX endopeptidase family protein [Thermomicrobiales bacterium]|nr:type II CAAX endopeptidase family protein [Thermomicrobiales bacterium]
MLGFTFFLVWWAHEAERDKSAMVGLYLMLGSPGFLLFIAGLAVTTRNGIGGMGPTLLATGFGLLVPTIHPLRVLFARVCDFDPRDPVHILGSGVFLGGLGFLGAQLIEAPDPGTVDSFSTPAIILQGLFFCGMAVIAVGYKIDRTWPQVEERLGLIHPTATGMKWAGVVVVFAFVVSAIGSQLTALTNATYADEINKSLDVLTGSAPTWIAAPVIGLSAGIGEELLFRGAIQPRYGIIPTALLFALLHNQYGFSFVTLSTFLLGCALGWLAQRYGTTHAIIAHTVYNTLAVLLSNLAK